MADIVYPGQTPESKLNLNALPSNADLIIYKGDYLELFVTLKDEAGVALDLTGFTPEAVLKADYYDRAPKPFTCTLDDAPAGRVRIFMSSTITSELMPGAYIWDFQVTDGSGETRTYLAGDVTVYNEVTT